MEKNVSQKEKKGGEGVEGKEGGWETEREKKRERDRSFHTEELTCFKNNLLSSFVYYKESSKNNLRDSVISSYLM